MSQEIRNLEPKALWNQFADLNAVPRPSKKEEQVMKVRVKKCCKHLEDRVKKCIFATDRAV
jgi:di/tripeptidase